MNTVMAQDAVNPKQPLDAGSMDVLPRTGQLAAPALRRNDPEWIPDRPPGF